MILKSPPNTLDKTPGGQWKRYRNSAQYLAILSAASSLVLASYVLAVNNFVVHRKKTNALEAAARYAAEALAEFHVDNIAFGSVGICDREQEEANALAYRGRRITHTRGINTVYASLRLCTLVNAKLKNSTIAELIGKDLLEARHTELELAKKMNSAVEQSTIVPEQPGELSVTYDNVFGNRLVRSREATGNFIYRDVYHYLVRTAILSDSKLVDLKIKLGFLRWKLAQTAIRAPDRRGSATADDSGFYRAGVPIELPNFPPVMFTTSPGHTQLADPSDFVSDERASAPSAILVRATFEESKKGKERGKVSVERSVCIVIGDQVSQARPSALVLTFPQGLPAWLRSANQILQSPEWNVSGCWRQSFVKDAQNDPTFLAPGCIPLQKSMPPNEAFAIALYHWLKTLPSNANPDKCWHLLVADCSSFSKRTEGTNQSLDSSRQNVVNSCLVQDTDARTLAFVNQGNQDGLGQLAVNKAFGPHQNSPGIFFDGAPPSSLPLFIDRSGNCKLAGAKEFDSTMIEKFFSAIYETNLAALETISVARQMNEKVEDELTQLRPKLNIEKQEWNAIFQRLHRQKQEEKPSQRMPLPQEDDRLGISELLPERFKVVHDTWLNDNNKLERLMQAQKLSLTATANAAKAIELTYRVSANAFTTCREGIIALNANSTQFLIGKDIVFSAETKPLSEFDFDEIIQGQKSLRSNQLDLPTGNSFDWLKATLSIEISVDKALKSNASSMLALKRRLDSVLRLSHPVQDMSPVMILFNSQGLTGEVFGNYPFSNISIPEGQLVYYCQNALRTGKDPEIGWSVLIRDLAASYSQGNMGQPIPSSDEDWCKQGGQAIGACPGLITEFQLRSPVPILKNFPPGSIIRNAAGSEVSQIPTLPGLVL
jgi:hypothetical protein